MNSKLQRISIGLALAGACAITTFAGASTPDTESAFYGRGLVGTWQVKVTLQNCSTGVQIGMPFDSLLTFADGGTLTETRSTGRSPRSRKSLSRLSWDQNRTNSAYPRPISGFSIPQVTC